MIKDLTGKTLDELVSKDKRMALPDLAASEGASRLMALIQEKGFTRLTNDPGCLCGILNVYGIEIEASCHKSRGLIRVNGVCSLQEKQGLADLVFEQGYGHMKQYGEFDRIKSEFKFEFEGGDETK